MIGGYFNRTEKGFEISKDQFGEGKYKLYREDPEIKIVDIDNEIAKVSLVDINEENKIEELNKQLLEQLVDQEAGGLFLEVIGGTDSLKQFLRKLMQADEFQSN